MQAKMGMKARTHADAESFLRSTQVQLETNEAANSLMLGLCLRLVRTRGWVETPPYLKTIEDQEGLVIAATMTPPHKLVVYGHRGNLHAGARILAADLSGGGWRVPGVFGPSEAARSVVEGWEDITGQRCELERRQRVYKLQEVKRRVPERGRLRLATVADRELVAAWRYAFENEALGEADREESRRAAERRIKKGDIYLWEDDEKPVSMAMKTRPTTNGISVGLVYTPPDLRRRGYATACVGELSRLLLQSGWRHCALFADVANASANRMYQTIGYRPVCDYDEYVFLGEEC